MANHLETAQPLSRDNAGTRGSELRIRTDFRPPTIEFAF